MTTETPRAAGPDVVLQPLVEFWTRSFEQGLEQTQALWAGGREALDPAALRRRWFEALSQTLDRYMRTPAFLEAMRHHFDAVTQAKSTTEDWARDVSRATGLPRVSDISGLFERLQIGQEAILARLEAIEQRLEAPENAKRKRHEG